MKKLLFFMLVLLTGFTQHIIGQSDSLNSSIFSGNIVDDSVGFPVPAVHVWNERTRMGCISNDSGEFRIKVRAQDKIVFSAIGYVTHVLLVTPELDPKMVVRLIPKKYVIEEVVVRRFRSYESFIYQVVHHDLPESETAELRAYLKVSSTGAALEADRERAIKEKLKTGRVGYITPLGKGVDREKAFKEKMEQQKRRERVIHTKFNRELLADITQLKGDELTEFIAWCNFSEEYLYETDLYTIMQEMYDKLNAFQLMRDTIPAGNDHL